MADAVGDRAVGGIGDFERLRLDVGSVVETKGSRRDMHRLANCIQHCKTRTSVTFPALLYTTSRDTYIESNLRLDELDCQDEYRAWL